MATTQSEVLRIIDANLNRIGEGLRVLEELARLMLNDAVLTQRLKNMRHEILNIDDVFQRQLLQARDSAGDVGAYLEVDDKDRERDLPGTAMANSRRIQEALRVLEELAKMRGTGLDIDKFKKARFVLYAIEKELLARLR